MNKLKVYTDGASRGNPGKAAIGIVILNEENRILLEHKEFLRLKTNNEAEYIAVIKAFELAENYSPEKIEFFSDSQLVVNQLNGLYKVKALNLKKLHTNVKSKEKNIEVTYTHVPRTNKFIQRADELANIALNLNS